jgi:hypothetical protein
LRKRLYPGGAGIDDEHRRFGLSCSKDESVATLALWSCGEGANMASMLCVCGTRLSNNSFPGGAQGFLLSMKQADKLKGADFEVVNRIAREVWECGECGRLAIFAVNSNEPKWYSPDDSRPGGLFAA